MGARTVYVLFPPLRLRGHDSSQSQPALRDGHVLELAATLLRRGDDFARECLSQKGAARAASLRSGAARFNDPGIME